MTADSQRYMHLCFPNGGIKGMQLPCLIGDRALKRSLWLHEVIMVTIRGSNPIWLVPEKMDIWVCKVVCCVFQKGLELNLTFSPSLPPTPGFQIVGEQIPKQLWDFFKKAEARDAVVRNSSQGNNHARTRVTGTGIVDDREKLRITPNGC